MRTMSTTLVAAALLLLPVSTFPDEEKVRHKDEVSTTWTNRLGEQVSGNWGTSEIIEINNHEDYYWHYMNHDTGAHYVIAPWLPDPYNLAEESGGDNNKN